MIACWDADVDSFIHFHIFEETYFQVSVKPCMRGSPRGHPCQAKQGKMNQHSIGHGSERPGIRCCLYFWRYVKVAAIIFCKIYIFPKHWFVCSKYWPVHTSQTQTNCVLVKAKQTSIFRITTSHWGFSMFVPLKISGGVFWWNVRGCLVISKEILSRQIVPKLEAPSEKSSLLLFTVAAASV